MGRTGKNFGAGMSGGLAFVYDETGDFETHINPAMIGLERLADPDEIASLKKLIALHAQHTTSPHAQSLLENWPAAAGKFWKVIPHPPTAGAPKPLYRFNDTSIPVPA